MKSLTLLKTARVRRPRPAILGACVLLFSGAMTSFAQPPMARMPQQPQNATADAGNQNSQAEQIAELRAQIARLQASKEQTGSRKKSNAMPGMKMGTGKAKNDDKGEMGATPAKSSMPVASGAMKEDEDEMGGMPGGAQSNAPAPAMGMCCMGKMGGSSGGGRARMGGSAAPAGGGMAGMSGPSSAMPGQPGASHLYHIGSTGFFLNHSRHITLT